MYILLLKYFHFLHFLLIVFFSSRPHQPPSFQPSRINRLLLSGPGLCCSGCVSFVQRMHSNSLTLNYISGMYVPGSFLLAL